MNYEVTFKATYHVTADSEDEAVKQAEDNLLTELNAFSIVDVLDIEVNCTGGVCK